MTIETTFPKNFPPEIQSRQPGIEKIMNPSPIFENEEYNNEGKRLKNKIALISGGDSGIGRAVALAYSREGAKVAIIYLNEDEDADITRKLIEDKGGTCLLLRGDVGDENFCKNSINSLMDNFGQIDVLVNNSAEQHCDTIESITAMDLERTFKTNIFGAFYLTKAAVPNMKEGSSIINTTSVVAYHGHKDLLAYSSTKGALTSFTRSLSLSLASKGIRVNAVAPGPIWTPLIPSSFKENEICKFGEKTAMKRAGQPVEVAEAYVFLASQGASYITGETIHINGGEIVNS